MNTDKQEHAIQLMAAGRKLVDIEQEVGISHSQLWEWRKRPEFRARLEAERASYREQLQDKLLVLIGRSMDVALEALDEGDPKTAIEVLRLTTASLTDVANVRSEEAELGRRAVLASGPIRQTHACESCGKECRTPGALASHRRSHREAGVARSQRRPRGAARRDTRPRAQSD